MTYNFQTLKGQFSAIENWLNEELSLLRTGKATPRILDKVQVDTYGSRSDLKHVGSIAVQDARTLYITPWDTSLISAIQKGIDAANLGVSAVPDGSGVRVTFPELTGERRAQMVKQVGIKLEEARISVRTEREKIQNDILSKEKTGGISEDERFRAREELQHLVDDIHARLEALAEKKRSEMTTL